MKRCCSVLLLLLMSACAASRRNGLAPTATLAIVHASVVDVENGRLLPDQTVLVAGNRIVHVGPAGHARVPAGAHIVQANGKYLIPGLWDMHVHLRSPNFATEYFFPLLVANGITGVRDMGAALDSALALRRRAEADALFAPRIVVAGPSLAGRPPWESPAGHLWRVETPEEARAAVDSLHRAGVDFIKVHDFLPRDVYLAIADEAERLGVPLAGHLRASVGPVDASEAGQRSIEHIAPEFAAYCAPDGEARAKEFYSAWRKGFAVAFMEGMLELRRTRDRQTCREVWARLRSNGTWVVPTMVLRMQDSSFYSRPGASYLTPAMRKLCDATIDHWAVAGPALTEAFYRDMGGQVVEMHRAGVPLLAGSDAGSACLVPGFSLHDELEHFVAAGFTPLDALRTATLNPTRFLEATDSLGTVQPGKLADLVLLSANPLEDIRNAREVAAVILNGRYLDRRMLDQLLEEAKTAASARP